MLIYTTFSEDCQNQLNHALREARLTVFETSYWTVGETYAYIVNLLQIFDTTTCVKIVMPNFCWSNFRIKPTLSRGLK
jgi:hypothetical protein